MSIKRYKALFISILVLDLVGKLNLMDVKLFQLFDWLIDFINCYEPSIYITIYKYASLTIMYCHMFAPFTQSVFLIYVIKVIFNMDKGMDESDDEGVDQSQAGFSSPTVMGSIASKSQQRLFSLGKNSKGPKSMNSNNHNTNNWKSPM